MKIYFEFNCLRPKYKRRYRRVHKLKFQVQISSCLGSKIVSEYDQEIPQSQTADNRMAPRGRAAQPSRDTRKTN